MFFQIFLRIKKERIHLYTLYTNVHILIVIDIDNCYYYLLLLVIVIAIALYRQ